MLSENKDNHNKQQFFSLKEAFCWSVRNLSGLSASAIENSRMEVSLKATGSLLAYATVILPVFIGMAHLPLLRNVFDIDSVQDNGKLFTRAIDVSAALGAAIFSNIAHSSVPLPVAMFFGAAVGSSLPFFALGAGGATSTFLRVALPKKANEAIDQNADNFQKYLDSRQALKPAMA